MIRVLIDGIPTGIGGIGTIIINLVKNLDRSVFDITFLLTYDSSYETCIRDLGCKTTKVPPFGEHPMKYRAALKKHFKKEKYDYIWINNTSKVNLWLPQLAKRYGGSKIIFHSHGEKNEFVGIRRSLVFLFELLNQHCFYRLLDIAFACSENSATYFYDTEKLFGKPVHIIYNAIDVSIFRYQAATRQKMREQEKVTTQIVLGTIGRLSEVKNHRLLIELLTKLNENGALRYRLYIVGDGPLRHSLQDFATQCGQNASITFAGNVTNPEDYMQLFDVFLLPSLFEGMPLVLVEAQAAGLPCLVSSTVSRDTQLSDSVHFLPLENLFAWVNQINNISFSERSTKYHSVVAAGYDIHESVKQLESILLKG